MSLIKAGHGAASGSGEREAGAPPLSMDFAIGDDYGLNRLVVKAQIFSS
jgi:hypothetical protein